MTPRHGRSPRAGGIRRTLLAAAAGAAWSLCAPSRAAGEVHRSADGSAGGVRVDWPTLRLLDGTVLGPDDWRDRAGVLVVWSTTCPFCRRHNPHVEALHRATAGRALRVVGVALDRDPAAVRRYVAEQGYTFPITLDADTVRARFALRRVIPMTVTVDRTGRLLQRIPGEMFEEDVMALAKLADRPA